MLLYLQIETNRSEKKDISWDIAIIEKAETVSQSLVDKLCS